MTGRSKVQGVAGLRRALRRLPGAVREELADTLTALSQRLLARAKAETPVRTGGLRQALAVRIARKTLTMTLGLVTRGTQRRFFYGYILDQGRRAQTVTVRRRRNTAPYRLRVSPIARSRYEFVYGRRRDFGTVVVPEMREAVSRALEDVARG
jgi:hypothetical protein